MTAAMQVRRDLPRIGEHEVVLVRAAGNHDNQALERVADSLRQHFRL